MPFIWIIFVVELLNFLGALFIIFTNEAQAAGGV